MPIGLQCFVCEHQWGMGFCAAFPDGIPTEISTGIKRHDVSVPGQGNKLVFKIDPKILKDNPGMQNDPLYKEA